ncbi:c-di-GMP-binding flagellar brake protein YcgR [Salsuginibacillus halophilus]|uniref:C-di-GMP-binding flagellar brake protein YcgR n=1 Tax=Salsuginibacillus halophilus TaxID=517424 RepID=A0A2P8HWD2_9BACI|nr:PilZ domain-containing protein [Salsuginibacillus halophilus]PSL50475.1 c-di-GMP-binding flagellar brake protein YcgR [Salsuginibacillus halophilus]
MIEIGDTLYLEMEVGEALKTWNVKTGEKLASSYVRFYARLVDHTDEHFVIEQPTREDTKETGYFFEGTGVRAWFIGKDQAVYTFDTEIQGKANTSVQALLLHDPGRKKYARIQRRNYVRVFTEVNAALHPLAQEAEPFATKTIDLSGGGAALYIPPKQPVATEGEMILWLVIHMENGQVEYIRAVARIVRVTPLGEGREDRKLSVKFIDISSKKQERVIEYCLEKQMASKRVKSGRR